MGYYIGKAKFAPKTRVRRYLMLSLTLPFLWHGLYDWILSSSAKHWAWMIIPFMIVLWIWGLKKNRQSQCALSIPHRGEKTRLSCSESVYTFF